MSITRCSWVTTDPLYQHYHDFEWGVPVHDDRLLFEFLILEWAQAGLSWFTILKRRETYREAFDNFDATKVSRYNETKVQELLKDEGIIRNKLKVNATIKNAQVFLKIQEEFGSFDSYLWGWTQGKTIKNHPKTLSDFIASSPLSDQISKDLKKRGMSFVGTTIIYAYLQAVGVVNDHQPHCFCSKK